MSNGKTIRHKTLHLGHLTTDQGENALSDLTIFVHPELAREIGMWGTGSNSKKHVLLDKNNIMLISWNPQINQYGKDKIITKQTKFQKEPVLGMCPLELWRRDDIDG